MTSRELTSGFDFWSRGHLRMAVVDLSIKFCADILSSPELLTFFRNRRWRQPPSWIFRLCEFGHSGVLMEQQGGRMHQLVGPRRALYAQLRKRHQLLRPCRALCPFHAYFRVDSACSHRQKKRAQGTANHPRRPNSPGTRRVRKAALLQ